MNTPDVDTSNVSHSVEQLAVHDHACLLFETRESQFSAIVPYIRIGLMRGEKCVYFADDNAVETAINLFTAEGIDVEAAQTSGALVILTPEKSLLMKGYFDPDEIMTLLTIGTMRAQAEGFSAIRIAVEMIWALGREHGVARMVEYEAKLDNFISSNPVLAICQYNLAFFSSEIIRDVIHTHPKVICKDTLCLNPYYVPPAEFLEQNNVSREVDRLMANMVERKRAEEALRESEERFRNMFEKHNAVMLLIAPESGAILNANKAAEHFYGYSPEQLKNMLINEINILPTDQVDQERKKAAFEKRNFFVFPHRLANGETRVVEVHSTPISIQKQPILFSIIHDVTERNLTEAALENSQEHVKTLFSSITDALFVHGLDMDGLGRRFLEVNDVACKRLGYTRDELLSMSPEDIDDPNSGIDINPVMAQVITGKTVIFEQTHIAKDGTSIPVEISARQFNLDGKPAIFSLARDITERKRTEQVLRDKQQRLSDMAVELSLAEERERRHIATELHDTIGQDLVLTQIKLGMLAQTPRPDEQAGILGQAREILGGMIKRVRFLTHMISPPLLDSAGLEAAIKWLGRQMETDYGLQVAFVDDTREKPLTAEIRSVLYYAVRELLINVAKHAHTDTVGIKVGREGDRIVIITEDDGIGFYPGIIEDGLTGKEDGFGLFNIRRRIIHLGGTFGVESSPGLGTRVTIRMNLKSMRGTTS